MLESASQGGCLVRGVSAPGVGVVSHIPACTEADPPVNRMTDRCKNITLATTSLRPVMSHRQLYYMDQSEVSVLPIGCIRIFL